MNKLRNIASNYPFVLILFACTLLFGSSIGFTHLFDWDEINFAESAREMLLTGNYSSVQINFEPFWEKPPLFFWLQALSMSIFGINEFAARFPNFIVSIITISSIFYIGTKQFGKEMGTWWVLLFLASITPHFYFKTGIIDPLFNLFIFLSIFYIYKSLSKSQIRKHYLFAGLLLGLAVLTKGPVALLIVFLAVASYLFIKRFKVTINWGNALFGTLLLFCVSAIWFLPEISKNGFGFLSNFLEYQIDLMKNPVASHGQPWFYHPIVLLIGCFPASIIALKWLVKSHDLSPIQKDFWTWMVVLFWVVLILFSVVSTKIVHYSSLCYLPLTAVAAMRFTKQKELIKLERYCLFSLGAIFLSIVTIIAITLTYPVPFFNVIGIELKGDLLNFSNSGKPLSLLFLFFTFGLVLLSIVFWLWHRKAHSRYYSKTKLLFFTLVLWLIPVLLVPSIESKIQGDLISFYKSIADEDKYIDVKFFKSYAHLYYANVQPITEKDGMDLVKKSWLRKNKATNRLELTESQRKIYEQHQMNWMLEGEIDKNAYIIVPARKAHLMTKYVECKQVFEGNNFVVYKRNKF